MRRGTRNRRARPFATTPIISAPPEPASFSFIEGLDNNNYYTGSPAILPGLIPSFYVHGWLLPRPAGGLSVSRYGFGSGTPNVSGYRIQTAGLNATLNFAAASGIGTYVATGNYTIPSGDLGKALYAVGCHTGSALRLWVNGVRIGSDVVISGYAPAMTEPPTIGFRPADSVQARQQLGCAGWGYGPGVPTDAEVLACYNACVLAGDIVPLLSDTDIVSFKSLGNAASVPSSAGFVTWSKVGAPTLTTGVTV